MGVLLQLVSFAIGCWLIGSEYSTALGWGLFFILIGLN